MPLVAIAIDDFNSNLIKKPTQVNELQVRLHQLYTQSEDFANADTAMAFFNQAFTQQSVLYVGMFNDKPICAVGCFPDNFKYTNNHKNNHTNNHTMPSDQSGDKPNVELCNSPETISSSFPSTTTSTQATSLSSAATFPEATTTVTSSSYSLDYLVMHPQNLNRGIEPMFLQLVCQDLQQQGKQQITSTHPSIKKMLDELR